MAVAIPTALLLEVRTLIIAAPGLVGETQNGPLVASNPRKVYACVVLRFIETFF